MESASYIGLSRQMAMRRQMDIVANNLANINTSAFNGERVLFSEYLVRPSGAKEKTSYVLDYGTRRNLAPGRIEATGNPLDIALSGTGYLTVDTPSGPRYTRNGHLRLDSRGRLTADNGYPLLDNRNRPIQLNQQDGTPTIAPDGTISNATGPVGRLNIVEFQNEQQMQRAGDSLYATSAPSQPARAVRVVQGAIENSNVEPITEMTEMIDLLRNYQSVQRMMETDQELQRRSIERLAKAA